MTESPVHISNSCRLPKLYDRPSRTAYYKISAWPLVTEARSPTAVRQSRGGPKSSKRPSGARLVPLESASCGVAMEVAKADSKTNWEALMNHINNSIRDTQQQRMLGQYMIQKLKKEQSMSDIPPDQAAANQKCLESLIERYGTGLEGVVSKEREFERLIEAYQVFMRGDKKKLQRKVERKQQSARRLKPLEEASGPAVGDQKAGRSQVGCKIRHELRKEYGERVRLTNRSSGSKRVVQTQPAATPPKPMSVRVRKSVQSGGATRSQEVLTDRACDEVDLPPTPVSIKEDEVQESESMLSLTYVPSENVSLAQLLPEDEAGFTVEIIKSEEDLLSEDEEQTVNEPRKTAEGKPTLEEVIPEESTEELEQLDDQKEEPVEEELLLEDKPEPEECLVLEGDSDPNVLVVNSQTELVITPSAPSPKFEIVSVESLKAEQQEEVAIEETLAAPEPKDEVVLEPVTDTDQTPEQPKADKPTEEEPKDIKLEEEVELQPQAQLEAQLQVDIDEAEAAAPKPEAEEAAAVPETIEEAKPEEEEEEVSDEAYQVAAVSLVNDILEKLDVESLEDESEKPDLKEVHFKSSPDILYYEKQSPEHELACHPDDKLILSEDLSTAESELDEEAKALYHKVLSTVHTEPQESTTLSTAQAEPQETQPDEVTSTPAVDEDEELREIARELTDTIIQRASSQESSNEEDDITAAAKMLTESALQKAASGI